MTHVAKVTFEKLLRINVHAWMVTMMMALTHSSVWNVFTIVIHAWLEISVLVARLWPTANSTLIANSVIVWMDSMISGQLLSSSFVKRVHILA